MKKNFFLTLAMLILSSLNVEASFRCTENFNREWRFQFGDIPEAESPDFRDDDWEAVGLPHSFSIPYFMSKDFYVGYGWYRKQFRVAKADLERCLFLEFDGVFQEAQVYVNGILAGEHVGGYTGFSVDITRAVRAGTNLVAVRVNNEWKPGIAPRAGEHTFSGGIYRNVRLVKKGRQHIGWCGTVIETTGLEESEGKRSAVRISTSISNMSESDSQVTLRQEVVSHTGEVVCRVEQIARVRSSQSVTLQQATPEIQKPLLWSVESPNLYTLRTTLLKGKKIIDQEEQAFGFRWMQWSADRGFFLNGKHVVIRGANVHQDQAGWGDAVTDRAAIRDVQMMKEAGFNFIRGSHYPHSPQFVTACDSIGMLFWSENVFWGIGGFGEEGYWNAAAYPPHDADTLSFERSLTMQLEEMVRIHRNHPSIVAWSMCNEPFFTHDEHMPKVSRLLRRLVERCRRLDPSRPAAIGGAQRPYDKRRIDLIGDIAGYNGDGATVAAFQNPGVANVVAEYGSVTSDRPGEYVPGWGDLAKDEGWKGRPWRSGQSIWCGFDHGSIAGSSLGKMGIVDYFRIPKRAWYWYRNEYAGVEPPAWPVEGTPAALRIEASRMDGILTDGTDDVQLTVCVLDGQGRELSASPCVTLRVLSGPGYFPTGKQIAFAPDSDIRIQDGKAAIAIRSYYAGETVVEATSPGLCEARLVLRFIGDYPYVAGESREVYDKPYKRFVKEEKQMQTFGYNNPVFASSEAPGHPAANVTGNDQTKYWKAAHSDLSPYITLDTEKTLVISQVALIFPIEVNSLDKIQISKDGLNWIDIYQHNGKNIRRLKYDFADSKAVHGRFVRVVFLGNQDAQGASLSEIRIRGIIEN